LEENRNLRQKNPYLLVLTKNEGDRFFFQNDYLGPVSPERESGSPVRCEKKTRPVGEKKRKKKSTSVKNP